MKFAVAIVRVWTRIYTSGLPPETRDARRREIASDLWESTHGDGATSHPMTLVLRLLAGVADDLAWRREQPGLRRPAWLIAIAISVTVGLGAIWLMGRARTLPLPPPPEHVGWHARFDRLPGPPPPPPPPPCPPPEAGHAAAPGCSSR